MLLELNVKDVALIKKVSVSFEPGLNILTGETGTGKSVIIGSAMLALGAKAKSDMIRRGAEYAYIELIFEVEEEKRGRLKELSVPLEEDGTLILSRKITAQRSVSKINDETVTAAKLREVTELLIDIYGQNEHQTLKNPREHLRILDDYLHEEIAAEKEAVRDAYRAYQAAKAQFERFDLNEAERLSELDLISFQINEIEEAALSEGEEDALSSRYKKLSHAKTVFESLEEAYGRLSESGVGEALSSVQAALRYDDEVKGIYDALLDADSILSEVQRDLRTYTENLDTDEGTLRETEERLDLIRSLQAKYGQTVEEILSFKEKKEERCRELTDYDAKKLAAEKALADAKESLYEAAERLREKRKAGAKRLSGAIKRELLELSFAHVELELQFSEKTPGENGADEVCFMAALNPGEELKPLSEVASGGELSRIMLAIKTVLAETDDIPTLIFDEIDTGISGRTAQKVSEKLNVIGRNHQVICITHLPQIAAMADTHFVIQKTEEAGHNVTDIRKLSEEESLSELARLLGGARLTKAVYENAEEMRLLAKQQKGT